MKLLSSSSESEDESTSADLRLPAALEATAAATWISPCRSPRRVGAAAAGSTVVLDASRSYDPDGSELTFVWKRDGAPVGAGATLAAEAPAVGASSPRSTARFVGDGALTYATRATDPDEGDVVGVHAADADETPLSAELGASAAPPPRWRCAARGSRAPCRRQCAFAPSRQKEPAARSGPLPRHGGDDDGGDRRAEDDRDPADRGGHGAGDVVLAVGVKVCDGADAARDAEREQAEDDLEVGVHFV